jgi:hypothetical protein
LLIKEVQNGKAIYLSRAFDSSPKILYLIYSIAFFFFTGILLRSFLYEDVQLAGLIFLIIASVISGMAAYRFMHAATATEMLHVYGDSIAIINKSLFRERVQRFELDKIHNFRHLPKPDLTDHPLKGQTFDYLGFQTEQKVINEMHGDNRIAFEYEGKTLLFGKEIYSWDFREMELLIFNNNG